MTSFPKKSIQLTVHVLQSQQRAGPFSEYTAALTRTSAASRRDQPTWTNLLSLPRLTPGRRADKEITVERRNAYGRGLAGLVGSSRRWRLLLISRAIAMTKASPKRPPPTTLFLQDHNQQPRQPLGNFEVDLDDRRWSGSLKTQIWSLGFLSSH